jgi:hypothetical protein
MKLDHFARLHPFKASFLLGSMSSSAIALVGLAMVSVSETVAQELQGSVPLLTDLQGETQTASVNSSFALPLRRDLGKQAKAEGMSQVTNVSELRDVQPTEWAFEALRSLVERYGCIVGYPDQTFRGNRALTRWEFAAGLNACMNTLERLIQENVAVLQEDLDKLKRLAEEFKTELAALGARVENLEARVTFLEDHQFSTTTKLSGQTFIYLSNAWRGRNLLAEGANAFSQFRPARDPATNLPETRIVDSNPATTFSYLTWLNFNTSFSGKDNLTVQFAVGNGDAPVNQMLSAGFYNSAGTPFTLQSGATRQNQAVIRDLFYSFPATNSLQLVVGPRINIYRYFDNNRFTFFINGSDSFDSSGSTQFSPIDRGSGGVAIWKINDIFTLKGSYLGNSTEFLPQAIGGSAADPNRGWFGGTYAYTAELDIAPTNNLNLRFLYQRSRLEPNPFSGFVGGAAGEPIPYGLADDGFGGPLRHAFANALVFNFDWLVFEGFGLFGRYSYATTVTTPVNADRGQGKINSQAFQIGFALPDLGKDGAQMNFSYVIPMAVISGREFLVSGGGDGAVSSSFEWNYFYPINNNIALVPSFYLLIRPNNFGSNAPIYVGNLRTQFTF